MSDFKGTPGNWALGMDGEILSDAGYIVMGTDLIHGNESDLELIAAAPELLEALSALVKALNYGTSLELTNAEDLAGLAIKKALSQ